MATFVRSRNGTVHVAGRFETKYHRDTWCGFDVDSYQMTELLSVDLDNPKNKRVCEFCFEWLEHQYIALRDAPSNKRFHADRAGDPD